LPIAFFIRIDYNIIIKYSKEEITLGVLENKTVVGFVPFGIHVNVEDGLGRQFIDYELLENSKGSLVEQGFHVIGAKEVISYKNQAAEALTLLMNEKADVLVLYSTTWMWASEIMWLAKSFNRPVILWSPATSRGWTNVGALEVHGALEEIGVEHKFIIGQFDDERTMKKIRAFCKAAKAKHRLQGTTLGLVGGRGMGETTGSADPSQWMMNFGIDIEHMDQMVVIQEAKAVDFPSVEKAYDEVKAKFDYIPALEGVMEKSIRLYIAMKKIYSERGFDMAAVKCYPELGDNYATPCLAQSLLADEGFTSACIGDLNTALTAQIMGNFTDVAVFSGDIQQVRYWENVVKIVCDGACPPSLAGKCKTCGVCSRGLPSEGAAGGMGVSAILKKGRCTLVHIARMKGRFTMHIAPGEVFEPDVADLDELLRDCGMPHWTHAYVKIDGNGEDFYQNQLGEFVCLAYGDIEEELVDFCNLADITPIITK